MATDRSGSGSTPEMSNVYDAAPVASSVATAEEVRSTTCGSAASSTPGSPTYSSTIEPSRSSA